ncbi:hypothetical protein [Streptomyces apocyni]|nr:hypothetical protein [Streptomyces apocyni]
MRARTDPADPVRVLTAFQRRRATLVVRSRAYHIGTGNSRRAPRNG